MFCSSSFHQHSQQQQKHQRCCCYLQRMSQKPCCHQRCCCEFMPSPTATSDDPASIKCAACGCHRNFHRCEPEELISTVFEYQPHHRHHPPPPPLFQSRSPSSPSPPPISSYPSAPHMLLALSGVGVGLSIPPENTAAPLNLGSPMGASRKRLRRKFTQDQKEKMHEFAERVRWKMQKRDEEMVNEFCNEVGVDRSVLKVWMHNNKNTLGRKLSDHGDGDGAAVRSTDDGVSGGGFGVHENDNNGINVAACARLTLSCVEGGRSMFGSSSQGICLPSGLHQATSASQMPSGVCF